MSSIRETANQRNRERLQGGNILAGNNNSSNTNKTNITQLPDRVLPKDRYIEKISLDKLVPAPKTWNFFPPLSPDKMLEMKFSILENKLFSPIIVWEQKDGNYMILSGHNRTEAYRQILDEYGSEPGFDKEEFESIPATVFGLTEINENKAREVIIDTNYIQRDEKEDKYLTAKIIQERTEIVKNRKDKKGKTIDIVAEEMGLSRTKVYEDSVITNKLIPELQAMYFGGDLSKKPTLRMAWFTTAIQRWIVSEYPDCITDKNLMLLKKGMSEEDLINVFTGNIEKSPTVTISIRVPGELEEEAKKYFNEWVKAKKEELKEKNKEETKEELEHVG